jgi:hypothetical protein
MFALSSRDTRRKSASEQEDGGCRALQQDPEREEHPFSSALSKTGSRFLLNAVVRFILSARRFGAGGLNFLSQLLFHVRGALVDCALMSVQVVRNLV